MAFQKKTFCWAPDKKLRPKHIGDKEKGRVFDIVYIIELVYRHLIELCGQREEEKNGAETQVTNKAETRAEGAPPTAQDVE